MHYLLILILVISFKIHLVLANTSMKIKKCCPEHQQLFLDDSDNLKCANVEDKEQIQNVKRRKLYRQSITRPNTSSDTIAKKCEHYNKTNGNNETFGEICAKETNETKNETIDVNKNAIWWLPNDLKFIRTNNKSEIERIENLILNRDSFIFNEPIPCFNLEPEVILIEGNVFIDVDKSELVLSKLEKVPEYNVEVNNYVKRPNQATSNTRIKSQRGVINDTQSISEIKKINENTFDKEESLKITANRNEMRKQGFENEVNIVTRDSNKSKKQYGVSPKKITSRFHRDDFCIDRFAIKSDADSLLDDDDNEDDKGLPLANYASPDHLDQKDPNHINSSNAHDVITEDTNSGISNDVNSVTSNDASNYVILLCPCLGKSTRDVVCVKKCCPDKHLLHVSDDRDKNAHCAPFSSAPINPNADLGETQIFSSDHDEEAVSLRSTPHYIVHAIPHCSYGSYLLSSTHTHTHTNPINHPYKIISNSTVLLTSSRSLVAPSEYCIDSIYHAKSGRTSDGNILLCRLAKVEETSSIRKLVYTTCFIVGTTFLVLTLSVYAMLSELRKSVHSWNIISHVACSIVAYVGIVVANLYDVQYPALCVLLAYIIQTSFLSSQLWLNVMCIDIAFTFSGLRAPRGSNFSSIDRRKFFYYSCYTWGTTACIAGLTALADQTSFLSASDSLKPNFGVHSCWFKGSTALAVFFYGPIGVLLLANLVLFHYTCWKIRAAQKETAMTTAHRHVGGRTEEQTRLATFLKLFLLMGITWSFELLSWSLGGPRYIWYLTDFQRPARGVYLHHFCCK
ncbi:hypothetical protein WDU94_010391, partial [Cyamophila willieti]